MKSWIALIAMAGLMTSFASANPPEGAPPAANMEQMAVLLDLTEEQKAQVQTILEEQHAKLKYFNEPVSPGAVPGQGEGIKAGREVRQETLTRLQAVLTPDQLKKYEALTEKRVYRYTRE